MRMLKVCRKADLVQSVLSAPTIIPDIMSSFIPYASVLASFAAFVKWNGGIVLGESTISWYMQHVY